MDEFSKMFRKLINLLNISKVPRMRPKVSIIIPTFNDAIFIIKAISSVLRQSFKNWEIIIVNDGSSDNTQEIIECIKEFYPAINILHLKNNSGAGAAKNRGIEISSGEYIICLDCDCFFHENILEIFIESIEKQKGDIVYSNFQHFTYNGKLEYGEINEYPEFNLDDLLYINNIPFFGMFSKKVWKKVGGFDESQDFKGAEDWEFWINVCTKGYRPFLIKEVLLYYRNHKNQVSITHTKPRIEIIKKALKRKYPLFYL
jgi:glycosyltransferase involved in cell wall biosynthesis